MHAFYLCVKALPLTTANYEYKLWMINRRSELQTLYQWMGVGLVLLGCIVYQTMKIWLNADSDLGRPPYGSNSQPLLICPISILTQHITYQLIKNLLFTENVYYTSLYYPYCDMVSQFQRITARLMISQSIQECFVYCYSNNSHL